MSYFTVDELRVASPCPAQWSDMQGDDYARHCISCDKNVYNLSLLTSEEANNLIREKEGKLCVSLYRRFDGTVLTADCPVGLRAIRRQYLKTRAKAIALALSVWGFITGTSSSCNNPSQTIGVPVVDNFSADINGKYWQSGSIVNGINDTTVNEIWIQATASDSTSLWIFIDSTERAPGKYENHRGVLVAGGYNDHTKFSSNYWYSGELKITSIDSYHASGTFWFNANRLSPGADTVAVTNGNFNVEVMYGKIPN